MTAIRHKRGEFVIKEGSLVAPIVLEPRSGVHRLTLIWLHGFGQDGESQRKHFECEQSPLNNNDSTRVVLVTAPKIECLHNNQKKFRRAWVTSLDEVESSSYSFEMVEAIVQKELEFVGGDYSKVIIGGFSQGGVLAASYTFSPRKLKLGGLIICSGFCHPGYPIIKNDVPVIVYHARDDRVMPAWTACMTYRNRFVRKKIPFEFVLVPQGGHEIAPHGRQQIRQWLEQVSEHGDGRGYKVSAKL